MDKDIYMPRLPSYKKMKETKDRAVTYLTLDDLEDKMIKNTGLMALRRKWSVYFSLKSNDEHIIWQDSRKTARKRYLLYWLKTNI